MTTMGEMRLEMLAVRTPRGNAVHLYDCEGDRKVTLCGRRIGVNPRRLGLAGIGPQLNADQATCQICKERGAAEDTKA